MTIRECIKKNGWQTEVSSLKRYQFVNIDFINADGERDEVQFDISGACSEAGVKILNSLFKDFCKDNSIKANTVLSITVAAASDTLTELSNL